MIKSANTDDNDDTDTEHALSLSPDAEALVNADARNSIADSLTALTEAANITVTPARSQLSAQRRTFPSAAPVRALSEIERDLHSVEARFADAESRRQQAEADAKAALISIDEFQAEIDAAVAQLRQDSPEGSRWNRGAARSGGVLTLKEEAPANVAKPSVRPAFNFAAER